MPAPAAVTDSRAVALICKKHDVPLQKEKNALSASQSLDRFAEALTSSKESPSGQNAPNAAFQTYLDE
jgi:hypothetical protein